VPPRIKQKAIDRLIGRHLALASLTLHNARYVCERGAVSPLCFSRNVVTALLKLL
jgi:hypothetical protein